MTTHRTSRDYMELEQIYGAHNYHPLPVVIARGDGVWVYDVEGRRYIDMLSSYSAINHGHLHPTIVKRAKEQLSKLTLTSRAFYNDQLAPFLEHLCSLAGFDMALPMNTGAEAVETAIKMVRKWGYEKKGVEDAAAEIIVFDQNFHGRTTTIIGFSSSESTRRHFGPFTPGFVQVPYDDLDAVADAINENTVALLVEPIQGEAGVVPPSPGYLRMLRALCDEQEILLAFDEIQTGLARTGKLFAFQHEDARPDVLILGKALGGGILPISATLADREVMEVFTPGTHGSTFGGNPLACAVADAALSVIEEEHLAENATNMGVYFRELLSTLENPSIIEVRGKGLLIGVEFDHDDGSVRPMCEALVKNGVLAKDTHTYTIRFAPPLIITKDEIDWAFERIKRVIDG